MPLFANRAAKAESEAAAQAECDRLRALSPGDLAAALLPAFGTGGMETKSGHRAGPLEVVDWLLTGFRRSTKYRQPLLGPTIEGLQALEHAGLVTRSSFGPNGKASTYRITRLGESCLADGSTREKLAPSGP